MIEVLRIKEEVRNAQIFTKVTCDHREQKDPTQH
jgi:hypothetical protein